MTNKLNKYMFKFGGFENSSRKVFSETETYFENNPEFAEEIDKYLIVFRAIMDLVPLTVENFLSGNLFPYLEAEYELNSSIFFAENGFYKHAITSLRSVLELGLLNVYWDVNDNSHIEIQEWLHSKKDTPFRKEIIKKLLENRNIKEFDKQKDYFTNVGNVYLKLCNYTHTKGARYSSRALSTSNYNTFNEKALKYWLVLLKDVIKLVMILHILKYPLAYQYTPIDEKFGLNPPAGGFLNPTQADHVREIFDENTNLLLQQISDSDDDAKQAAEWVNNMPDITEEQIDQQLIKQDQENIKHWVGGFSKWLEQEEKILQMEIKSKNTKAIKSTKKHIERMTAWAKKEGLAK